MHQFKFNFSKIDLSLRTIVMDNRTQSVPVTTNEERDLQSLSAG